MHLSPTAFTPLEIGLTMSFVVWLCARAHHLSRPGEDVFFLPRPVCYLFSAFLIVIWVLFLGAVPLSQAVPTGLVFSCIAILSFRYRVVVTEHNLVVRGIRRRTFSFADVVDVDRSQTGKLTDLVVYLRDGRRIKLIGMLGDIDQLESLIQARMAGPPAGRLDSVEKLRDRENIARGNRNANRIGAIGVALAVALFVCVKWMGLL